MGRLPNAPTKGRNGNWWAWHPAIKKRIDLGTADYGQACAIQNGFYPGRQAFQTVSSARAATVVSPMGNASSTSGPRSVGVIDFDKGDKPDATSLLSKWATAGVQPNQPVPMAPAATETPSFADSLGSFLGNDQPKPVAIAPKTPGASRAKPGLTPEQSAKLAGGLKKIVTNLNVIIVGAGVQMFGRVPAPLDDDEIEMLQMGWEMFIDELFLKSKIKPWHVLLAGNLMVAAAMYVGGTPIPKKQLPPGDGTKAKSASVTPIDGGKKE